MATAFAVFCATDGSLTFYNRDIIAIAGSEFEGKLTSEVFTGFDSYASVSDLPWFNIRSNIISVSFAPEFASVKLTNAKDFCNSMTALTSFDSTNFDTSNVINMKRMFYGCNSLTSLDLSNFDTSKVTDMSEMFDRCKALTSLDLSGFDTSKVNNMSEMFNECLALTALDLSNFNTSNVTNMSHMFYNCQYLRSLDLSNFDTSKVTDMSRMFQSCNRLITIYTFDNWSIDAGTDSSYMFEGCHWLSGAISYTSSKTSAEYANYITGYFTDKTIYMLIKNSTLYKLADKVRILANNENNMTPTNMVEVLSNIREAKGVQF